MYQKGVCSLLAVQLEQHTSQSYLQMQCLRNKQRFCLGFNISLQNFTDEQLYTGNIIYKNMWQQSLAFRSSRDDSLTAKINFCLKSCTHHFESFWWILRNDNAFKKIKSFDYAVSADNYHPHVPSPPPCRLGFELHEWVMKKLTINDDNS